MGLGIDATYRRHILKGATRYEPFSTDFLKQYDTVVVDVSATGRHLLAPFGGCKVNMMNVGRTFVKTVMSQHTKASLFVLCYDNPQLSPAIRSSVLHLNRYGPKLDQPPESMNEQTHVFVEGRVYPKHSSKIPAQQEQVDQSTLTELQATVDQMFSSENGKKKLMALHAEAVKRSCETALATGDLPVDATVLIVPPSGDCCSVLTVKSHAYEPRLSQYGEADMLIMVYAERSLALGKTVYLRTIDTDAILQSAMFTYGEKPGGTLDLHVANVYQSASGDDVFSTAKKAGPKAVRCREIVDISAFKANVSIDSQCLMLLYGCDYIRGMCIRGLGLPKKNLYNLILKGPSESFVTVARDRVIIDWAKFFVIVAAACKTPKPTASVNLADLNVEMQRLAYCITYFSGIALEKGGPIVDTRPIVEEKYLMNLFLGHGCAGSITYTD